MIIYSDDHILVINKPAGVLSIQDRYDTAKPHLRTILEPEHGKLWIVHRLDKDTSGVMVLAKNAKAHKHLNQQFENKTIKKIYHVLVHGSPEWEEKSINASLITNGDRRHRTIIDHEKGKYAHTAVKIISRFPKYSLLEAKPTTGYTHQIRAQLAYIGFPIVKDSLYGKQFEKEDIVFTRTMLHAFNIVIMHPETGKSMSFTADDPDEFKNITKL